MTELPSNNRTRSLKELLTRWRRVVHGTSLPQPPAYEGPDLLLSKLTESTAETEPGACFVARVRETSDGHPYIGRAIARGATMIVGQRAPADLDGEIPPHVLYLRTGDTAQTMAWLAAAWEDFPSRQLLTIGVTGTDGKSSTALILHGLLTSAGLKAGLLSTIKAVIGRREEPLALHVTTPEATVVQRQLRRMVDAGLTHCVLEATSHGLAQHRVSAVDFDMALVTNITHEHLDYHGGYEAYVAAKARLLEMLKSPAWQIGVDNPHKAAVERVAVLNLDDESYASLAKVSGDSTRSYGLGSGAGVSADSIEYGAQETTFQLRWPGQGVADPLIVRTRLVGEFNVYNLLAAAAAGLSLGLPPGRVARGLEVVEAIDGRMERIDGGQPFTVIVDFAHTPNALAKALSAARRMSQGRLIAVFGSAGKRDVEKRSLMAAVAAEHADLTVLTAEDPRTESLNEILETMAQAMTARGKKEGREFWRVEDRGRAIYAALGLARAGDLLLICGKGHEQSMCFGVTEFPWDDRRATRAALEAFIHGRPMPDLGLPTFS